MPRGAKVDRVLTERAHFFDKRSFCGTKSGVYGLYLYGQDMSIQRHEVFVRDKGRCQECGMWIGEDYGEVHHKLPRGKGGSDNADNLEWSCRKCHRFQHHERNPRWSKKVLQEAL